MEGIFAPHAGILKVPQDKSHLYFNVISGNELDERRGEYTLSTVSDLASLQGKDIDSIIHQARSKYWNERCVSLIQEYLRGLSRDLEKDVLEHIEEILESNKADYSKILDNLLIAPFKDEIKIEDSIRNPLSYGFVNLSSLLDELQELQPLLKRFTKHWLSLDNALFNNLSISKKDFWVEIIEHLDFSNLLKTTEKENFSKIWGNLAFKFHNAQDRADIENIGQKLAGILYPEDTKNSKTIKELAEEEKFQSQEYQKPKISNSEAFERVKKQIKAIIDAVQEGDDSNGQKFLRELIKMQRKFPDGDKLASKSLCNIAKQSADIFRYDFEFYALKEALRLPITDEWTIIQYADHLKRAGKYEQALEVLTEIEQDENNVAQSLKADIYSEKGNYQSAIKQYKEIENWENDPTITTALADIYRNIGHLKSAEKIYQRILKQSKKGLEKYSGETELRAKTGLAEIAKQKGNLDKSKKIYESLTKLNIDNNNDFLVLNLGYCNVLKLDENYFKAYDIIDDIIQKYPFAIEAKFIRGSILGLISKEKQGLQDLSKHPSHDWKEWLRRYYRGLLLLKLDRFEDAKTNLVDNIPEHVDSQKERDILRLGSAIWFLNNGEFSSASENLEKLPNTNNNHAKYLSLVLKLHIASEQNDDKTIKLIKEKIKNSTIFDKKLKKAIDAINNKEFESALKFETDSLLNLAA